MQEAGHHGHGCSGHQGADAGLERTHVAGSGAGAFGEQDEDGVVLVQAAAEVREVAGRGAAAPDRQGVDGVGGECGQGCAGEEGVARGEGEGAMGEGPGQGGGEGERVEVAGVVGDHDEGGGAGDCPGRRWSGGAQRPGMCGRRRARRVVARMLPRPRSRRPLRRRSPGVRPWSRAGRRSHFITAGR